MITTALCKDNPVLTAVELARAAACMQANVAAMEAAEVRATSVYRRVMERYPGNGKVMKVCWPVLGVGDMS